MALTGGHRLRAMRESLGYTMRDVETGSMQIALRLGNDEYSIPPSRLSDIETKGVIPSIFRLYSLAALYHCDYHAFLSWYGVDLNEIAADVGSAKPKRSHLIDVSGVARDVKMPVRLDPGFSLSQTANLARMVEQWGVVPLTYLSTFANDKYTYGYIGAEDFTMYPLLPPGSFVQIDEARNRIVEGVWRSEIERPIYFVETRDGFVCSWCSLSRDRIILQSHPLSPVQVRSLKHPQEAEVIGQVVGAGIRLGGWRAFYSEPEQKECAELT